VNHLVAEQEDPFWHHPSLFRLLLTLLSKPIIYDFDEQLDKIGGSMERKRSNHLQIGVTGHRFIPDGSALHHSIRQVLRDILECHATKDIFLFSALAEGSDQLVAKISLEFPEITLRVPLPKAEGEYLEDFASDAGRETFHMLLKTADKVINLKPSDENQSVYENLGNYLVNHSDVLIALWNGVYNQKKGGTGEVVRQALATGIPIYWIYCDNLNRTEHDKLQVKKQLGDIELLRV
jgi:hypothetical protein